MNKKKTKNDKSAKQNELLWYINYYFILSIVQIYYSNIFTAISLKTYRYKNYN